MPSCLQQGEQLRQHILILQQRVEDALHLAAEDLARREGVLEAALGVGILWRGLHQIPHLQNKGKQAARLLMMPQSAQQL